MEEMMKPASLNIEVSLEVFQASPERFGKQMCYTNVYRAITDNWLRAKTEGWKVAYGLLCNHNVSCAACKALLPFGQ